MWEVNPDVLHGTAALGGSGLDPFYQLLEGGKGGPLAREMEEYFYYAQMRAQSVATTEHRKVHGRRGRYMLGDGEYSRNDWK